MPLLTGVTLPSDGETADAADVNDVFNAILALINGGLDSDNLAANAVGTSELADGAVTEAKLASATKGGWYTGLNTPNTIAANGNRSYTLTFNTTDYSSVLSAGMRMRFTRSVAAPTQCTSLNGTTQYWVKTSPNKLSFTDDFVCSAWIKLSSYPSGDVGIVSRYDASGGFIYFVSSTGQLNIRGYNASGSNYRGGSTYQSVPINKWVHVAMQNDMSTYTATTTTTYAMIDGVNVPIALVQGGTNPTALTQSGNLEVGSFNGGAGFFPGKLAQVAIFNAKVSQSTMLTYISQGLSGSETNLSSAYSFNNSTADLNTTTPNDLSAGAGSPTATNSDSPFGVQASGTPSSTLCYGIIQSVSYSTNTTVVVQAPEGNTIPTSGGVSAVVYAVDKAPYGMPIQKSKWTLQTDIKAALVMGTTSSTWFSGASAASGSFTLNLPVGEWVLGYDVNYYTLRAATADNRNNLVTLSTANNAENNKEYTTFVGAGAQSSAAQLGSMHTRMLPVSSTTATSWYVLTETLNTTTTAEISTSALSASYIIAENAYL